MPRAREFEIIERYFARAVSDGAVAVGIGDDAAIIETQGPVAWAVDMLVAGTHFPAGLPARAIGHRALAVNLSDLAAVGAKPRWATLALALPEADAAWLDDFAGGFFALAERFGVSLIGGDTTRGPMTITVGVIGEVPLRPLLRSGGRAGDRILISGTLGAGAAGLVCLAGGESGVPSPSAGEPKTAGAPTPSGAPTPADAPKMADARSDLIERFSYPEPRVALGLALADIARAGIDISDGLVADLGHICERSGVGAAIELDSVPLPESALALFSRERCLELALQGGDDYELCVAVAPADLGRARDAAAAAGTAVTEIGELTAARGIVGRRGGSSVMLEAQGFEHFE
jgi:thiamine-monophosphate kinase